MQVGIKKEGTRERSSIQEGRKREPGQTGCHGPQSRRDLTKSGVQEDGDPQEVPEWSLRHKE